MNNFIEALEEQREVQVILSETLKNDDSNSDLEQELEELMRLEERVYPPIPSTKLDSNVDELERSLRDLHVGGTTIPKTSSPMPSSSQTIRSKQS